MRRERNLFYVPVPALFISVQRLRWSLSASAGRDEDAAGLGEALHPGLALTASYSGGVMSRECRAQANSGKCCKGMIAKAKTCVKGNIRSMINGAFMDDEIAYRPLECLTMLELGKLQRMATRYSEMVREHAYLVGLMNLALRTGDTNLLATTKKRLAQTELECNECSAAMRAMRQELLSAPVKDDEERLSVAMSETPEYATA